MNKPTNEIDENIINRIRSRSYLYQERSLKQGDGLRTTPYSDMVNKEMLFKIIDEMESGQNMYELETLLQSSIKEYKDSFRDQMVKYHHEI